MELKPGYKQTEVGVIPGDWEIKLLPEVCRFRGGKAHEQYISDLGRFVCVNSKFISTNGEVRKYSTANFCCAKRDDILMVMSDLPNGRALAKAYLTDYDDLYAVNQRVCALTPYRDSSKYLFYVLNRNPYFLKFDDGVNQTHLLNHVFQKCPVPLPPTKAEQEAIAEALSDADGLIESLEQLLAKKRHLKQGAMHELLTGKRRLPGFSEAWEVRQFGETAQPRKQRVDPRRAGAREFCLELEHIEPGTGRLLGWTATAEGSSLKSVFQEGDVLFGKLRAYLRKYWLADRDGVCSTEIWVLVANRSLIIPPFLFQLVMMNRFIEAASSAYGTHMPRSDWNAVKKLEVDLPSIEEQTAIATVLSDMDAEIAALEAKLATTRQLKQGMIQELLAGRIRLV